MRFPRVQILSFPVLVAILLGALLSGCGKASVRLGPTDPGFSLRALRADTSGLIVSGPVRVLAFKKTFDEAYGSEEALAARLSARLLDSMNHGTPAIPARAAAPEVGLLFSVDSTAELPDERVLPDWKDSARKYVLRIRNVTVGNARDAIPKTLVPAGPQGEMVPGGGGESESCVVSFDVEAWEMFEEEGTTGLARRAAFTVTGKANVVLFAYRTALEEAITAAVRGTVRQLRQ